MRKILVANRGEIALRVMKTIRKMGINVVAIYSEADRDAPHVRYADEAVCVGPPPSSESYLKIDKIIEVAKSLNVDGIHPGYGFLSENDHFAKKVEESGITFIGPGPEAIRIMGNKLAAKDAVKYYNIPMVPGTEEAITDIPAAKKIALDIGFPILIKAAAGGGGKGMRVVENEKDFEDQMNRAVSEALSSFGDGAVFIEKYIQQPRHIEIQVLADKHGNTIHLFERECSIQRRYQKVIEEAPSAVLTPQLRASMGTDAVNVAKACSYVGAGTVEFLLDADHNYYFLEMNTRLQVEHPVTEYITGIDLVEQQIRIARGEELAILQDDLTITGHSIELRVYAEDPENDFLPNIGKLEHYELPEAEGVRVDDGYESGMEIPIYYDPMISKLIVYAENRRAAIRRMLSAIEHYKIDGITTTLPFGRFVMLHEAFISGNFDTHFVETYYSKEAVRQTKEEEANMAALLALKLQKKHSEKLQVPKVNTSEWQNR